MANFWEKRPIGADVSKYNLFNQDGTMRITQADFNKWVDAGLAFLWAKCGDWSQQTGGSGGVVEPHSYVDPSFDIWCDWAYKRNIPFMGYYFFYSDPQWNKSDNFQYRVIKDACKRAGISVHGIAIDLEYPPASYGCMDTPNNITERMKYTLGYLNEDPQFANVPSFVYSSSGFLGSYAKPLINVIGNANNDYNIAKQWLASWVFMGKTATWQDIFHGQYLPPASMSGPKWVGNKPPEFWQYGVFHGMAGVAGELDINVFLGTFDQLYAMFPTYKKGAVIVPPIEPPVTPPTTDPMLIDLGNGLAEVRIEVSTIKLVEEKILNWAKNIGYKE